VTPIADGLRGSGQPATALSLSCPVCRARFRGTATCSRCGADLARLMRLAAGAWRLRRRSRAALLEGDWNAASAAASASRRLHDTGPARRLEALARTLGGVPETLP
jgi:hypothetical protein